MPKARVKTDRQSKLDSVFAQARNQREAGNIRSAFRLFLAAAKGGHSSSQVTLGNFYCDGTGVRPNRELALHWYRRALRHKEYAAANNIAVLFQNEGKIDLALKWFERATNAGAYDARVRVAKIYLERNDRTSAIRHLKAATKGVVGEDITEVSWKEAQKLLKRLERRPNTRS